MTDLVLSLSAEEGSISASCVWLMLCVRWTKTKAHQSHLTYGITQPPDTGLESAT